MIDYSTSALALSGLSIPNFWLGIMLILLFSVELKLLPPSGYESIFSNPWGAIERLIMPAFVLGGGLAAFIMRHTRSAMLEVLRSDYIRTARAKGLRWPTVLFKHALRNALVPVVALAAVQFGFMLGGSVVIETIFAMQGVGYLAWESISLSDLPVTQAIVLMISLIYIVLTLSADLLNAWLDPRIRIG